MKTLLYAIPLAIAALFAAAPSAEAGSLHRPPCYKTVVTYVTKTIAVEVPVVRYDHCGRPYVAERTIYKQVQVPITRRVLVHH